MGNRIFAIIFVLMSSCAFADELGFLTKFVEGPGGFSFDSNGDVMVDQKLWDKTTQRDNIMYEQAGGLSPYQLEHNLKARVRIGKEGNKTVSVSSGGRYEDTHWTALATDGRITSMTYCNASSLCATANGPLCAHLKEKLNAENYSELRDKLSSCADTMRVFEWMSMEKMAGILTAVERAEQAALAISAKLGPKLAGYVKEASSKAMNLKALQKQTADNPWAHSYLARLGLLCEGLPFGTEGTGQTSSSSTTSTATHNKKQ